MISKTLQNKKNIFFLLFGIFFILFFSFSVFAYTYSSPQYTQSGFGYSSGIFGYGSQPSFDSRMCNAGQDFVLQVAPTGCTPAVVRSDLLEEQDVWVFCPIAATKINPLIKIEAVNYLTFKNEEFSRYVSDIGFHPVRSALGIQNKLNSPVLENIGYAVVKLKKIPSEAEMPDFVEGNVTARLVYDIENAFGTFRTGFYLKPMKDEEWNKEFLRYGFWRGKGYIRAEDVQSDRATISVYSGNTISRSAGEYQQKLATFSLKKGEESQQVYLPTFDYCLGGLKVKLEDIKDPDTTARLKINADDVEVVRGERFLDNKCTVNKIEKIGLNQKVIISCEEDLAEGGFLGFGRSKTFKLEIKPKIELKIGDKTGNYSIGEWLFDAGEKSVFLSYAYTKKDSPYAQDLKVVFTALPKEIVGSRKQLTEDELKSFKGFIERYREDEPDSGVGNFWTGSWNAAAGIGYIFEMSSRWAISGESFDILGYHDSNNLPEELGISEEQTKYVTVLGLASPTDSLSMKDNSDYKKAMEDYDILYSDFSSIKEYELKNTPDYGQRAYEEKIKLARDTGQKKTMYELCEQFKEKYPDSSVDEVCFNEFEFASQDISSADVLIGNKVREISLSSIYEPTFDEYGAKILVKFSDGKRKEIPLQKNDLVYLNTKTIGNLPEKLSESEASKIASDEGIKWKDSVKFEGVRPQTLLEIIDLKEKCGCDITITSVTDGTHASGAESHSTGYKIDLRSKDISSGEGKKLYEYIKNNFEKIQDRIESDGTSSRQWKNKYGTIYTLEYEGTDNEHWDVLVIGEREDLLSTFKKGANQFIQLKELETISGKGSAVIRVNIPRDFWTESFKFTDSIKLEEDVPEVVSTEEGLYEFTLKEVNLEKVAKVSVLPRINYAESESSFSFKIGIDKRDIKLAPEKAKERIKKLNKTIEDLEKVSGVMGKTIQGLKGACLGVGGALHVKNLVENMQGKGIARQKVMRGDGGWYEICADAVNSGKIDSREVNYQTQDECLIKESENIDKDVRSMAEILARQQADIKTLQDKYKSEAKFLEEKMINTENFAEDYSGQVKNNLGSEIIEEINKGKSPNEQINLGETENIFTKEGFNKNLYDVDELRKIDLSLRILNSETSLRMKDSAKENLYSTLFDIQKNSKGFAAQASWAGDLGIESSQISTFITIEAKEIPYTGIMNDGKISELNNNAPVQPIQTSTGKQYLIALDDSAGTDILSIKKDNGGLMIYDKSGKIRISQTESEDLKNIYFKKYDKSSYTNPFKHSADYDAPVVKYYDTEAYKNLPSVVPFDLKNGWYAASRQNLPVLGNIKSYDVSGRVNNFYLCNVGADGIEEFFSGIGDDVCQQIFLESSKTYRSFPGLSKSEATNLVESAVSAIEQASTARSRNPNLKIGDKIRINTRVGGSINVDVGRPAVEVPNIQCQDFMSPKECNLIFNLCDPVICPSSRCDYGGEYPVKDVIQSGVAGSTLLCLPNARENIYVPVCLTGIQAGIDGFTSVEKAYRDCLQTSLDTGETVGICDEIQSVYMCDFFWRQAAPIGKIGISKVVAKAFGQGTRGGGEYLSVANAWESASKSIDYFTQSYGANSYQAFKSRSISKQLFAPVCEGFVSGAVPKLETFFDAVTEPDSPVQFTARFDEIPFSDVTVPPVSQYKVFYHIYAGKDRPTYYQVYLKPDSEGSFYQDAQMFRTVASGFIPIGGIATETKDFTAPSGYKKLCINVNGQEECGFKEVSTSFAVDYIKDQYAQEQITKTGVSSEKECASGTPSLYNFLTPNIQSSAEGAISPEIYKRGITRICATNNPGQGTDSSRWIEVGRCSDVGQNVKCWLDQQSIEDSIQFVGTRNKTIMELEKIWIEGLNLSENYEKDFNLEFEKVEKIEQTEKGLREKISKATGLLGKTFFNKQKAKVFFERGKAYAELAKLAYKNWKDKQIIEEVKEGKEEEVSGEESSAFLETLPPFGKSEIRFTFVDEKGRPLLVQYSGNIWNIVIIEQPTESFPVSYVYIPVEDDKEIKKARNLTKREENLVSGLKSKDYESGLKVLIDKTSACGKNCELIVAYDNVKMFGSKIFLIYSIQDIDGIYFYYKDKWYWNFKEEDIKDKSWIAVPEIREKMSNGPGVSGVSIFISIPQDAQDLIKSVNGKNFYEGAKIIFEYTSGEEKISEITGAVEISKSITDSYEKYKNLFEKYSKKNLPKGFSEEEFKALLVAISQKETQVGSAGNICGAKSSDPCADWIMGYDNKYRDESKGVEKQIALSSSLLKRTFEGQIAIYNKNCNLVYGESNKDKINCILNSYRGYGQESEYASTVLQFKQNWEAYFEESGFSEEETISCKSCGSDEHWYTFGLGNICDEEECKDIGRTLGRECVFSRVGGIPSCSAKS